MDPKPVQFAIKPLIAAILAVVFLELTAAMIPAPWLWRTAVLRVADILVLLAIVRQYHPAARMPGVFPLNLGHGIKRGLFWSVGFALIAAAGAWGLYLTGHDPFGLVGMRMPRDTGQILLFFAVGGLISPVAEELFFRGVIFAGLRRWGAMAAIFGSSLLFVLAHFKNGGIGFPQAAGGVVFALAYELEKNLMVPIVIHVLGNLALFSLGLWAS